MQSKPTRAHGPYIVTTRRPVDAVDAGHPDAPRNGWPVSRRAVATLDEAQEAAGALMADVLNAHRYEGGPNTSPMVEPEEYDAGDFEDVFPASGGSSGPLPDGTVIEVEPTTYHALWQATSWGQRGGAYFDTDGSDNIAAYNAQDEGLMS